MKIEKYRQVNEYNTPLDEGYYSDISREVSDEINSAIDEIVFVQKLLSSDMPSVNDLEKDEFGKVIVDVSNPHRLENMAYFRASAEHFRKHGCYTLFPVNKHPKSSYYLFWKEEKRRIRDGYVREDGEWIPGNLYWYWNYCPIMRTRKIGKGKRSERIHDFGDIWLGDYLFFHYIDQAKELGQHVELLKVRGVGNSFKMGSIGPRNALFYPRSKTFYVANDLQYLTRDGVCTKAWDYLDFLAQNTPFPRLKLVDTKLEKRFGYKDVRTGSEKGMKSDIIGMSTKDDPDKIRGKRGDILFEEYGAYPHIKDAWRICRASVEDGENVFAQLLAGGCVCAGTKVYTEGGITKNIEDVSINDRILGYDRYTQKIIGQDVSYIKPPSKKDCVEISTYFRNLRCSKDHPILVRKSRTIYLDEFHGTRVHNIKGKKYEYPQRKRKIEYYNEWVKAGDLKTGDVILVSDEINYWGNDKLFDARLVGMLIGDGSYGMRKHYGKNEFKTPSFSNCDNELLEYVLNNYDSSIEKSYITKNNKKYCEVRIRGLIDKLKNIGIAGQSKDRKRLPINFESLSKEDSALLIAGLFDTDGYVYVGGPSTPPCVSITQSSNEILLQIKQILDKFGITSKIRKIEPRISANRKDRNPYYTLDIHNRRSILRFRDNIPLLIKYKSNNLNAIVDSSKQTYNLSGGSFNGVYDESVINVQNIGYQTIYNLTASGSNTYLANGIVTHNTGGTEGADFEGAEDMFYYPDSYNILSIPNVYDRNTNGSGMCGFFWGAYLNRAECYDENGMPNVTKALKQLFVELEVIRKGSSDPSAITKRKAEYPITPQDSMMRIDGTLFPVADLRERLEYILPRLEEFVGPHYIGDLVFNQNGQVEWKVGGFNKPIREFPLKDNKYEGSIEIFEQPFIINGEAQRNRYIAGIDPYDDDASNTVSLGSIFILDLFTDRIVAEYTGRPKFANDFFETCRRMLLYYNAVANYENDKKGLFQYFDRKNSLYLLSDTLQSLKDVEMIRGNLYGNKAKGCNSGKFINARARRLLVDWMLSPAYGENKDGQNVLNLHKIRSIGLLLEAMKWNINGNFDRIASCGMLMLLREDRQKYIENSMNRESDINVGMQFDPYFVKNSKGTLYVRKELFV